MERGQDVAHERMAATFVAKQAGYVYIYLSNDETTPLEVFFDDFTVTHAKGPVVQSQDYYPFGLTFNSYSRENTTAQNYKFNGKEEETALGLGTLDYGWRRYQSDIGRWGSVDPLDENEYDREMDNAFNDEFGFALSDMQGDQSDDMSEMRMFSNKIGSLFRPINAIDAQSSAVHYNVSPYAYVLNNPLKYRDLMGLDTIPGTKVLPEVTVEGTRDNGPPHWLGPGMVLLGQPWVPKRFVTKATATSVAASPGTSIASTVLNKVIRRNSPVKLPSPVINKSGIRIVYTKSVGKFLGRWVPFVGWAISAYDFTKEIAIPMSQGAAQYSEQNRASGNWISNLPH